MIYYAGLAIAVALVAIAAGGCGVGQGIAVFGAIAGMARQPEMSGKNPARYVHWSGIHRIVNNLFLDDVLYSVGKTAQDRGCSRLNSTRC